MALLAVSSRRGSLVQLVPILAKKFMGLVQLVQRLTLTVIWLAGRLRGQERIKRGNQQMSHSCWQRVTFNS